MLTRIHVNQHVLKANRLNGRTDPPITVKSGKTNRKAHLVTIKGESRVVYSPHKPLACGARVWVETNAEVSVGE